MTDIIASEERAARGATGTPPLVTVIVPCFNAVDTLERAVRSALDQSLPGVEIHIVDDASTDKSWALMTDLWQQHDNIRLSRLAENRGRAFVGNYAFERSTAAWIAILDADDWYEPQRLERIIAATEAAGVEMGTDNQFIVDPGNEMRVSTALPVRGRNLLLDLDSFQANSDATRSFDVGMLKPVCRRAFLAAQDVEYYVPARRGQDYYFLLAFFVAGGRAVVIDAPLYNYVQPFGAISRQWSSVGRKRYPFEAMQQINDHFVATYADRLTPHQHARLVARGRQFDTVAALHQIREAVAEQDYTRIANRLMMGFPSLWWRLGSYVLRTMLTKASRRRGGIPPAIRRLRARLTETACG